MAETETTKAQQPIGLSRWIPSIPTDLMSTLNPFANEDENDKDKSKTDAKRQSIFSSFLPSPSTPVTPPEKEDISIMFAEPETRSNSDDGSREGSIDDSGRRKSRRCNKPKTCYSICHPPPASSTRQRFHRRPRSLLQLHKQSPNARPQPAVEVVPSANFSVRLTKAITKVFKARHGLCPNDLVVLRAEKYSVHEPDEDQDARDIIALICKGRKEDGAATSKARICLPEGREWEAYPTLNGGYEFFSTDEHGLGLTVRWVPKKNKDGSKPTGSDKKKFNFSTISPNSRRHPVIATLSRTGLDVNETYKMPEPSATTPLSTPKQTSSFLQDTMEEENGGKDERETDDRLRQIIVMTGIWVTFKEGWSPTFKYDDKEKDTSGIQRSPSLKQNSPSKSATFGSPVSTPPGSPAFVPVPLEKRNSIKSVGSSIARVGSLLGKGNRASTVSVPEGEEPAESDVVRKTGRARSCTADSSSTVLVHRAASNRTKNNQATWRPDLLSAQHEMLHESSSEDITPVRSQSASNTVDAAGFDGSRSPTHVVRSSVARPILPPTHQSDPSQAGERELNGSAATPRASVPATRPEKRESSTTTTTNTSVSEASRKPAKAGTMGRKKKSGWRRLLCGGNDV